MAHVDLPVTRPKLRLVESTTQVRLKWPNLAWGFSLQIATTLEDGGNWQDLEATPVLEGDELVVTVGQSQSRMPGCLVMPTELRAPCALREIPPRRSWLHNPHPSNSRKGDKPAKKRPTPPCELRFDLSRVWGLSQRSGVDEGAEASCHENDVDRPE